MTSRMMLILSVKNELEPTDWVYIRTPRNLKQFVDQLWHRCNMTLLHQGHQNGTST